MRGPPTASPLRHAGLAALTSSALAALLTAAPAAGGAAPAPGGAAARPAVVWAVGDGADGGAASRAVVRRVRAARLDRFLYLGDVYERGRPEEFRDHYDAVYGPIARITAPTPGNHEWFFRRQGYLPYWSRVFGRPQPTYYDFDLAGWRLLSLNSEEPSGPGSPQHAWITRHLR